MPKTLPRYPVYVPTKGRADSAYTIKFLLEDGVPFFPVVEAQELATYRAAFPDLDYLVLPFANQGLLATRNWIRDHATEAGYLRHWQLDDNIRRVKQRWKTKRIRSASGVGLAVVEDFVDRYTNVAVAGLNYAMNLKDSQKWPPFYLNHHVYSCSLILNTLPFTWRLHYNDDTDLCLQALANGWCTVLFNVFMIEKMRTMTVKGGNTDDRSGPINYQDDGRLRMARNLEREWPYVVRTSRRFQRPQHIVRNAWGSFDTPLIRRDDVDWAALEGTTNDYGLTLVQHGETIQSETVKAVLAASSINGIKD